MKKTLFINFNCNNIPHFETELELMFLLMKEGNDVYSLSCNDFTNCTSNAGRECELCMSCNNRRVNGFDLIGLPSKKQLKLEYVDCPDFPVFNSLDELKNFSIDGINLGFGVASTLMFNTRDEHFNLLELREYVEMFLESAYIIVYNLKELQKKYHFDSMYFFNGRFSEYRCILNFCSAYKVDYYLHERGCDKDKYNIIKNDILHSRIRIQNEIKEFWNNKTDDKLINEKVKKWFEDRRKGVEQCWISFVKTQEKNRLPEDFDLSQYNIGIFNSSRDEFALFDDWKSMFNNDFEIVKTLVEHYLNDEHKHFYLRIHPNLKKLKNKQVMDLRELAALNFPNLTVIMPEENIDTYTLMQNCQKILTFGSTIGIEATYWGKASILAGKSLYDDSDCVYVADDYETLYKYIDTDLEPKPKYNCNQYVYWASSYGIFFKYFNPIGLFDGSFLGEKIKYTKVSKINRMLKRLKFCIKNRL